MASTPGTKLGPYEIVAPLGAGGMGEVYRARDTRLDRTVAIKVLASHLSSTPELRQRMEREARSISSLNHPNICQLFDIGTQDGSDYLVMEFLEGETLADRLHKGPMPVVEACRIAVALAEALSLAHRQGILHRDLKPANIMLTKNGPKLMDFGLAKPIGGVTAGSGEISRTPDTPTMSVAALAAPSSPLTQKGMVVGTFQYMSPEALEGREVDARSDIFSFGCVLYEMVTGRRAFEGKSQFSVLGAILDKEPERVSSLQPSAPPRLDEIVAGCLAKDPDQRYGCMHDVRIQLQTLAAEIAQPKESQPQAASSAVQPARQASFLPWMVAALAALAALGLALAIALRRPAPEPIIKSSILPPTGTTFVTMLPSSGPPVLSPDGTQLAFTARDDKSRVQLYVRPLNSPTPRALPGTDDAIYPFWSPDSHELGFFAAGKLKRIHADGGPPQDICDSFSGRGGAWSKGGTIVFTPSSTNALLKVPANGGTPEPASKLDAERNDNSHRWPFFLPDGKHFLFWSRTARPGQSPVVYLGELGTLQAKVLMKSETMATYASGQLLFLRDQVLMAQAFDPDRLELKGDPVPLADHIAVNGATVRAMFSASDTGRLIYQTGEASQGWTLAWWSRNAKLGDAITKTEHYLHPSLSPDGKKMAVVVFAGNQGVADIWVFDLTRETSTRLTFGPASESTPVWSPDGMTVYYSSSTGGPTHIHAKAADGSGPEHVILDESEVSTTPRSISRDGCYLVYERRQAAKEGGYHIWAISLHGDEKPFAIVQDGFDEGYPSVSPDGKWMAYQSNETGRREIYITAFPGGGAKWQVSSNGGIIPKWRRDGKELFFLDPTDNLMAVDVNLAGGAPRMGTARALFQAVGIQRDFGAYDVTADGKKFLINSGNLREGSDPFTLVVNWPAELNK
jgi:eukaryotic-like serine/threonine-protein kinase